MTDKFTTAFNVTAWFETSGQLYSLAVGNFDKQGCSWGPRQTCIGQGSLQPLMRKMLVADPDALRQVLGPLFPSFQAVAQARPTAEQLEIVVTEWNDDRGRLKPEWVTALGRLGGLPAIQSVFQDDARGSIPAVDSLAKWIAIGPDPTIREWCLAYDFVTQNGGFASAFKVAISAFLLALKPFQKDVRDRMRAVCWLRAGWTYILGQRQFADDVLGRKLLIVEGSGKFRGSFVDLDEKFGVNDEVAG
jgi:hypothetical protein